MITYQVVNGNDVTNYLSRGAAILARDILGGCAYVRGVCL